MCQTYPFGKLVTFGNKHYMYKTAQIQRQALISFQLRKNSNCIASRAFTIYKADNLNLFQQFSRFGMLIRDGKIISIFAIDIFQAVIGTCSQKAFHHFSISFRSSKH